MFELGRILRLKSKDQPRLDALQTRLQEVATRYRVMIATVPSDLPGAPFPEKTLTKRHEWVDANILNPVSRLRDAISDENRPLLSTWPEFMGMAPPVDFAALDAELEKVEQLGKYLWMNTRIRRAHNVSPGWEIKFEIVRAIAGVFSDILPNLKPSRGTYDREANQYRGSFPEAIILAFAEITGFEGERLDRHIADYIEEYCQPSTP